MTLAMACSSPFSMIVLYFAYGRMLNRYGPRKTLCLDILLSSFVFAMSSFYLHIIDFPIENEKQTFREPTSILPMMIFFLFMYQNSYVGLLQTQYWSFIGSLLSPAEGKVYFAPISGVSSITSTIAAAMVSRIVVKVGLQGLLMGGALSLIASAFLADKAYQISEEHGFDPSIHITNKKTTKKIKQEQSKPNNHIGIIQTTKDLFSRVPTLSALFCEVITCGFLSSLLNFMFVFQLKETIPEDFMRAGYSGKFYALINATSAILQFGPLSYCLQQIDISYIWIFMPTIMLCFSSVQCFVMMNHSMDQSPSLFLFAASYFVMKTIEYSLHGVACEMAYVTLDYESRFIGKEIVGVLGNRVGRSGISLALSVITKYYGELQLRTLSCTSFLLGLSWFCCGLRMSRLIPTQLTEKHKMA